MTAKKSIKEMMEEVNHPSYYGGKDDPYECAKVLEAWGLDNDWYLATAIAYMCRAGRKDPESYARDILKAKWFVDRKVDRMIELEERETALKEGGYTDAAENSCITISEGGDPANDREYVIPENQFAEDVREALRKRRWRSWSIR